MLLDWKDGIAVSWRLGLAVSAHRHTSRVLLISHFVSSGASSVAGTGGKLIANQTKAYHYFGQFVGFGIRFA